MPALMTASKLPRQSSLAVSAAASTGPMPQASTSTPARFWKPRNSAGTAQTTRIRALRRPPGADQERDPQRTDQQMDEIGQEGRAPAFEGVSDELQHPAREKKDDGERPREER